jgi:hypothetical protein
MKVRYLTTLSAVTLLSAGVVAGCANPCAAQDRAPTEETQTNPCASKDNPCASKSNPCASKDNPCASKSNPCAAKE